MQYAHLISTCDIDLPGALIISGFGLVVSRITISFRLIFIDGVVCICHKIQQHRQHSRQNRKAAVKKINEKKRHFWGEGETLGANVAAAQGEVTWHKPSLKLCSVTCKREYE